jgi:hypothetical protein
MFFQDFLIGLLIFVVGAAFCFVGYRFFRILIAIWGFLAGFNLGAVAMTALFGQNFRGQLPAGFWDSWWAWSSPCWLTGYITLLLCSWAYRLGMALAVALWVASD